MNFGIDNCERLKHKKSINTLFSSGKYFYTYPFKVYWMLLPLSEQKYPLQFGISAPKKFFKTAVLRNYLKRIFREAFRYEKHNIYQVLSEDKNMAIALFVVFSKKGNFSFAELRKSVKQMVSCLVKHINNCDKSFLLMH